MSCDNPAKCSPDMQLLAGGRPMLAHVVHRDRADPAAKHPKGRNGKLTVVLVEPETNTNIAVEMLLGGSRWHVWREKRAHVARAVLPPGRDST